MESGSSSGRPNHGAYTLVVQGGAQTGMVFPLRAGANSVGRSSSNQIMLADRTVSARHALIHVGPEGIWVQDLGSKNGTLVNGSRISGSALLQPGDALQMRSSVVLTLVPGAGPGLPAGAVPTGPARREPKSSPVLVLLVVVGAVAVVAALALVILLRKSPSAPGPVSPTAAAIAATLPAGQPAATAQATEAGAVQGGAAPALATRDSEAPVAVGDATATIQPDASLPQRGAASPDEMGSMNQGQNVAPGSQLSSLQVVAQPSVIEVGIPEWVDVTEAPPLPDEVLESLEPEDLPPPGQPGFDPNESPFCR